MSLRRDGQPARAQLGDLPGDIFFEEGDVDELLRGILACPSRRFRLQWNRHLEISRELIFTTSIIVASKDCYTIFVLRFFCLQLFHEAENPNVFYLCLRTKVTNLIAIL